MKTWEEIKIELDDLILEICNVRDDIAEAVHKNYRDIILYEDFGQVFNDFNAIYRDAETGFEEKLNSKKGRR